jgi:putative CocE/NonD family hydrolase
MTVRAPVAILAIAWWATAAPAQTPAATRAPAPAETTFVREHDVPVPMRDGVVLRADVWRPSGSGPFPVLVYRTPYGKSAAQSDYTTFGKVVERGYAVVMQDVRGRFASDGEFEPYRHEGRDGFDTIEWAARQPWSNGSVGTFGLSYPGAVQWLAAVEGPPHLKAMVPAMTFASANLFFYAGGVWDNSWAGWVWEDIAGDLRRRRSVPGPTTDEDAERTWGDVRERILWQLPLAALADFEPIAPWYYEWMRHPPWDPWWKWADLRDRYAHTGAAVLGLSGWYDEAYGPDGATTNFTGLTTARAESSPRAGLVIGPWPHGVRGTGRTTVGDRENGPDASIDYDETVLRWMDRYVRDIDNGGDREASVRVFVMGDNRWREADRWPIPGTSADTLYLAAPAQGSRVGGLSARRSASRRPTSSYVSNPAKPVTDRYADRSGAHDYRELASRSDVLTFETPPLDEDLEVVGAIAAEVYLAADAPDADLWVKVLDVAPDGMAYNLMAPGSDVIRASYRDRTAHRSLLEPGRVYLLRLPGLLTGNTFKRGHRIRVHVMSSFAPNYARNLQTGASETQSARMRSARITIHHDARHPSRLILPVIRGGVVTPSRQALVIPSRQARDLRRPGSGLSVGTVRIPRSARDDNRARTTAR